MRPVSGDQHRIPVLKKDRQLPDTIAKPKLTATTDWRIVGIGSGGHEHTCAQFCAQWRLVCACFFGNRITTSSCKYRRISIRTNRAKLLILGAAIPSKQRAQRLFGVSRIAVGLGLTLW